MFEQQLQVILLAGIALQQDMNEFRSWMAVDDFGTFIVSNVGELRVRMMYQC